MSAANPAQTLLRGAVRRPGALGLRQPRVQAGPARTRPRQGRPPGRHSQECALAVGSVVALSFFLAVVRITPAPGGPGEGGSKETAPGNRCAARSPWREDDPRRSAAPRAGLRRVRLRGSRVQAPAQRVSFLLSWLPWPLRDLGLASGELRKNIPEPPPESMAGMLRRRWGAEKGIGPWSGFGLLRPRAARWWAARGSPGGHGGSALPTFLSRAQPAPGGRGGRCHPPLTEQTVPVPRVPGQHQSPQERGSWVQTDA